MSQTNDLYEAGATYKACITDQMFAKEADNKSGFRVILTVRPLSRVKDRKDTTGATEECPHDECEVSIRIDTGDDASMVRAGKDLQRLGLDDDDPRRFHPEHPQALLVVGKEVHVKFNAVGAYTYCNLAWPLAKADIASLLQDGDDIKKKMAAARAMPKHKRDAAKSK
jgi:hypothetical protein